MRGRSALIAILAFGCGTSGEGPRDAAAEASPPRPARGGAIWVEATRYTVQEKVFATTTVSALFRAARSPACVVTTNGACTKTTCASASPESFGAGTITVDGFSDGPTTMSPNGALYTDVTSTTQRFAGGEELHASAAGGTVPAFARAVTAPPFLTVTSPSWAPAATLVVPRTSDLVVKWDGGGSTSARAFVRIVQAAMELRCEVEAKAGTLVVPRTELAPLARDASIRIGAVARDLGVAGDYATDFVVEASADRGGAVADGPVSIE